MSATLVIFWDGSDPNNMGWAGCIADDDEQTTFTLPHRRRDVGLTTLARSIRRAFRGATPDVRAHVRDLCARLRVDRDSPLSATTSPLGWKASL